MTLRKNIIIILNILFIISLSGCQKENEVIISSDVLKITNEEQYLGYLYIPKIKMNKGFYNYDNPKNNVNKNIQNIKTGIKNTYLLAAHSGTGKRSFFNDLRYLEVGDEVYLKLNNELLSYKVTNIIKTRKNGTISIKNQENMLYLTTCDQIIKGYQLTIECAYIA